MTTDPETEHRAHPRESFKHWIGRAAENIPPGWMDDMLKRLFEELNRQMIRAENASVRQPERKDHNGDIVDDPDLREQNARILARLQTQYERLTRMETQRAPVRAAQSARKPSAMRDDIVRKHAELLEARAAGGASGEAER